MSVSWAFNGGGDCSDGDTRSCLSSLRLCVSCQSTMQAWACWGLWKASASRRWKEFLKPTSSVWFAWSKKWCRTWRRGGLDTSWSWAVSWVFRVGFLFLVFSFFYVLYKLFLLEDSLYKLLFMQISELIFLLGVTLVLIYVTSLYVWTLFDACLLLIKLFQILKTLSHDADLLSPSLDDLGVVFNDVYTASKFAMEGFCESMAVQLMKFNIR